MSEDELHIDEHKHERVPPVTERLAHALLSAFWGFLLVNIIAFWMFPGIGLGSLYMLPNDFAATAIISDLTTVFIYTFLAICLVLGWFRGQYFVDRLKRYLETWKFW